MLLNEDNGNYLHQNWWMLDLEDLHSIISIISLVLRIINEQDSSFLPQSALLPSVMDCNEGRSIQIISFKFIQYSRLLLIRVYRMHNYLMWWIVDLEDLIIIIFNICSIPPISNELSWNAWLPIVMDCRFGRSNHYNNQYHFNTSNHKGTIIEIVWTTSNCSNLNGL